MSSRAQRILVVDDDPALAAAVGELLRLEGYRVSFAHDGRTAIERIATHPPDLVILDIQLPDRSGVEVLRRVRSAGFTRKILLLSSLVDEVSKVVGLNTGADDYVTKPFSPRELVARVRSHLRDQPGRGPAEGPAGRRVLRSILFLDMEGYSRRVGRDEALGLGLLAAFRRTVATSVQRHGGTVIDSPGDAFMVSFESALHAVRCGLDILGRLDRRNRSAPRGQQIRVRTGIHVGEVLEQGRVLRGNTVNIAARLEQIGHPASLTVTEEVLHAVEGALPVRVRRLGLRHLKNIRHARMVFRLSPPIPKG